MAILQAAARRRRSRTGSRNNSPTATSARLSFYGNQTAGSSRVEKDHSLPFASLFIFGAPKHASRRLRDFQPVYTAFDRNCYSSTICTPRDVSPALKASDVPLLYD